MGETATSKANRRAENVPILNEIAEILVETPDISIKDLSKELKLSQEITKLLRGLILKSDLERAKKRIEERENPLNRISIPPFKPTAVKVKANDGTVCTDVSEFFGITEYGGRCYKDVRFTIPRGDR